MCMCVIVFVGHSVMQISYVLSLRERRICFSFPLKKDEMAIMRVLKLISDATTTLFYLQFLMGFLRKSLLEWLFL